MPEKTKEPKNRLVNMTMNIELPCWFACDLVKRIEKEKWKGKYEVSG